MKYLLIVLVVFLVGCNKPKQQYVNGSTESTITHIGIDAQGQDVYVREIVITRGYSYNTVFVRCDSVGVILPSVISNSYKSGKNHTIIGA